VSGLGDGLAFVAFPLLVTTLTRDPRWVVGMVVAQRLPWLLLSLHAGAFADRLDRRRLLGAVESARMAVLLVLGLTIATHTLTLPILYAVAASLGVLETVFSAATHAALPGLVRTRDLGRANGYLLAAQAGGFQFAGPALGGRLFAAAPAMPFVADGVTFAASAALLVLALPRMPRRPRSVATTSVRADVVTGLRWFVASPLLRLLALTVGVLSFCWGMATSVLVLYGLEVLHLSRAGYGVFLAVAGLGEVLGGVIAGRMQTRFGTVAVVLGGAVVASAAYLAVGLTSAVLVAAVAMFLEAFGIIMANVATISLRQAIVPPELLGRVGNAFRTCLFGMVPLGAIAGGFLGERNLRLPFVVAGVVQVAAVVAAGPALARRIRQAEAALADVASGDVASDVAPDDLIDLTEAELVLAEQAG
jgi:MFS family permease